jgi:hypothetical protein
MFALGSSNNIPLPWQVRWHKEICSFTWICCQLPKSFDERKGLELLTFYFGIEYTPILHDSYTLCTTHDTTHRQTHTHTHQNQHKLSECTITLTYTKHIYTYHTMHKTQQKHKPETVYNTTPRTQKHTLHLFLTILVTNNLWRTLEVAFHFQSFDFEEVELERTRESEFIR